MIVGSESPTSDGVDDVVPGETRQLTFGITASGYCYLVDHLEVIRLTTTELS